MSSLWTPDGERPVSKNQPSEPQAQRAEARRPAGFDDQAPPPPQGGIDPEAQKQMDELQRQLADTPADVVVANHCFGLFELAALHLGQQPPHLGEAQLAIDALGALVENLSGRLGEAEPHLRDGLSQLRVAFVQIRQRAGEAN